MHAFWLAIAKTAFASICVIARDHKGFSVSMNSHGSRNFFASSAASAFTP
jgi:hypothetical protein